MMDDRNDSWAPTHTNGGSLKGVWIVGVSIFFIVLVVGLLSSVDWSKHGLSAPSSNGGLDGTYVAEVRSVSCQMKVHGNQYEVALPSGYSAEGNIERTGDTVRFSNNQLFQNGYLSNQNDDSTWRVDLGKLINDGQTIEVSDGQGGFADFIRQ
jgi:hypothetical protein